MFLVRARTNDPITPTHEVVYPLLFLGLYLLSSGLSGPLSVGGQIPRLRPQTLILKNQPGVSYGGLWWGGT